MKKLCLPFTVFLAAALLWLPGCDKEHAQALPNQPPLVTAGHSLSIVLPLNSVELRGSAADPDGSIASYQWTKLSGPASYELENATQAVALAKNLEAGVYVFELTATDDEGLAAKSQVGVEVAVTGTAGPCAGCWD